MTRRRNFHFSSGPFSSFSTRWPIVVDHPRKEGYRLRVPTREHLFQALKTTDIREFTHVMRAPDPRAAKKRGRKVTLRPDWENVKYGIMLAIVRAQVRRHSKLRGLLLATGDREIIEHRPDPEWGDNMDGTGKNLLGKCWMQVRDELVERS